MSLQEQISQWSNEGRFDLIIEAAGEIPESELDMFTLCQLALAYNNTNRLEESIELLMTVWDVGESNPVWNYYLGYALVFSGRKEEARERFLKARELNPQIPAEKLLHFCVCYDGEDGPVDDDALVGWVCDLLGGERRGSDVVLPELGVTVSPWIDDLKEGSTCSATIYFRITMAGGTSLFECCVGLGAEPRDAVTAALGSFYLGLYSALQALCRGEKHGEVRDREGRVWNVYLGDIVGMGGHPMVSPECYWELLAEAVPDYLGSGSPVYVKVYGARNGEDITVECRVNDWVSGVLSEKLREPLSRWPVEGFASHKQFFFLECAEERDPYPYTQGEMNGFVRQAVELFCSTGTDYGDIPDILEERLGDVHLAAELHAFIPELCAERAFENISSGDGVHITAGERKIECTKWQVTAWRMIDAALSDGFGNDRYPENAFRDCVAASSTWSVICKAREDGHDLLESGGTVQRYYHFHDDYLLR